MGVLTKGTTYSTGDTVTAANLNAHVDDAQFSAGAVDGSTIAINTGGSLYIANNAIGSSQLKSYAVTPDKIDLDSTGIFSFANAAAQKHYSNQANPQHNQAGALTIDIASGNFQLVTVSANITSVAAITNAFAGAHFTFVLKYSGTLTGPGTGNWNSAWLFPSTYDGTLTMSNGAYDLISGVIVNDGGGVLKYIVTAATNLTNP